MENGGIITVKSMSIFAGMLKWNADHPENFHDYYGADDDISDGISSIEAPYQLGPEVAVFGTSWAKCVWTDYEDLGESNFDLGVYGDSNPPYE